VRSFAEQNKAKMNTLEIHRKDGHVTTIADVDRCEFIDGMLIACNRGAYLTLRLPVSSIDWIEVKQHSVILSESEESTRSDTSSLAESLRVDPSTRPRERDRLRMTGNRA
jgi:hypothetical protein